VLGTLAADPDVLALYPQVADLTPLKGGRILEIEGEHEGASDAIPLDSSGEARVSELFGLGLAEFDRALGCHYTVTRAVVLIPRIEKYGVPPIAAESCAAEASADLYGLKADLDRDPHLGHFVSDSEGDSAGRVFLRLERDSL
jgi:hypothetical protein